MSYSPPSLYNLTLRVASEKTLVDALFYKTWVKELRSLPNNILFDCYYMLYSRDHLCILSEELSDVNVINRLILVPNNRTKLLRLIQSQLDHGSKAPLGVSTALLSNFIKLAKAPIVDKSLINIGLRLGSLLNEGGWYSCCKDLMVTTDYLCQRFPRNKFIRNKLLQCYQRKLYAEVQFKDLEGAEHTYTKALQVIEDLKRYDDRPNLALIFSNFSGLFYMKSDYSKAIKWSRRALRALHKDLCIRIVIEVLRQASKASIVKRYFNQAGLLIKQALNLATDVWAIDRHPRFADTLSDYGFFLLNSDNTDESVKVYQQALNIRSSVFVKYNINVAIAHEDLAYVLYVHQYSSGSFTTASTHAETALRIMDKVIRGDNLLKSSAKRVKALILEEIALDLPGADIRFLVENYFREAEELHKEALASSLKTFGENNLLTAKQYGNLGRLYQSMKRFDEAEKMHLAAIAIKEELLGPYDYEVALSVGHLASLYNYQMGRYKEAEELYKRSIEINIGLFGESYSGLEYDYRGIAHIYIKLEDLPKVQLYQQKMRDWTRLRNEIPPIRYDDEVLPVDQIVANYFKMC